MRLGADLAHLRENYPESSIVIPTPQYVELTPYARMSATDSERRDYDNYMQDRGYADFREHPFRDRLKMKNR